MQHTIRHISTHTIIIIINVMVNAAWEMQSAVKAFHTNRQNVDVLYSKELLWQAEASMKKIPLTQT